MSKPAADHARGIEQASAYLRSVGYTVLDHYWQHDEGALDIVAVERSSLVVCVVKTRVSNRYRTPLEAVSQVSLSRLRKLGVQWLNAHGMRFEQIRVDVIGLIYEGTGGFTIEHVRGAG